MNYWILAYFVGFIVIFPCIYIDMASSAERVLGKSVAWDVNRALAAGIVTVIWPLFLLFVLVAKFLRG